MLVPLPKLDEMNFVRDIAPKDWMKPADRDDAWYFQRGYGALGVIAFECFRARMQPQAILDFGCGHGCVARMLRAHFPKARIVGQDVHADWMDWCGTHLGIETVVSPALIADVTLPENSYDLIWAGSIFSHLPESAALHLLAQFRQALTPTGIAVFSTAGQVMRNAYRPGGMHNITDAQIAGMTADFDAGNHAFCAYDKTIYDDWGHSLIPCQWMFGTARRLEMPVNGFYESGWGLTQDVYGLRKAPNSVSWR